MEIIQQIAVKAVEEIYESVKVTGLNDIGKTIKALTPVVSRTVLNIVTAFLEDMDEALVTRAKALRKEDGITVKERGVQRTWLSELGELKYCYIVLPLTIRHSQTIASLFSCCSGEFVQEALALLFQDFIPS